VAVARGEPCSIDTSSGAVEAIVEDPGAGGVHYAVICHPHPLYGGTMDNKVVTTVARALHECAIPTLRFNFRGVGKSSGNYDDGIGETEDAAAVAAWGAVRWPGRSVIVAGFSFGGYVALRLAGQIAADRLIAVAPAILRFDANSRAPNCPFTIIQGDADEVVDPQAVIAWASALTPAPRLRVLPGVGHFFHGRLHELRDAVIDAIRNG
jgi:alpha/beta superfamily hydrolase